MVNMGLGELATTACFRQKFRWLFRIDGVSGPPSEALPPQRGARPSLAFKEMELNHIVETIPFPARPDWKPVNLTLYDIKKNSHPVFDWIKKVYNPCKSDNIWSPSIGTDFKKIGRLEILDGCGNVSETWVWENIWPTNAEFGELDMSNSEVIVCELTLRYDRAYIVESCNSQSQQSSQSQSLQAVQ